jgi:predicted Fe-S protein YdhL (DUF1289 family)
MSDEVWKRDEIQSPCVKLCAIHPQAKLCTGCFRSIEEITQWSRLSDAQRSTVMAQLPGREGLVKKRRGGRAARLAR